MAEAFDEEIQALIARGAYVEAARLLAARGRGRDAIRLYERVWRFADGIPLALELGDRPLAARLALDSGDPGRAAEIAGAIAGDQRAELQAAAEAFAARARPYEAGRLAERAGDLRRAAALYNRAGALVEAARVLELAGELHEAGVLYERIGELGGDDLEAASARLALGRLLGRLGRHEDAARALQAAARYRSVSLAARRALCAELLALGFRGAAAEVVRRLRSEAPDLPGTPEEMAALEASSSPGAGAAAVDAALLQRRFRVQRLLGAGATGRVYMAEDTLLGRSVAVKLLSVGAGSSGPERQAYLRFTREAEAAGRLRHPNIVALHDVDEGAGLFVMELMAGGTLLDTLVRRGPLSAALARRLALDVLSGLAAAHDRGIVHRDVKPGNLFFDAAGNAKIGDFGAAHLQDFGQTQTGGFMGTVAYMPPEQISGAGIGAAADLYSLAATLFEALTGRRPFLGPDIVGQHLSEEPQLPSSLRPGLSSEHDAVILKAMRKAPEERYASAMEMAEEVRGWPTGGAAATIEATGGAHRDAASEASATASGHGGAGAGVSVGGAALALPGGTEMGRTARGRLFLRGDPRTGRTVLVEERDVPLDEIEHAAIRALAAAGGPHVQRVLALTADGHAVTYEALDGPYLPVDSLPSAHAAALEDAHRALKAAGVDPRDWPDRAALTPGGPVLIVARPLEA